MQCIAYYSRFALDTEKYTINNKAIVIPSDDPFLLSILNSRVIWWVIYRTFQHMKDDGLSVDVQFLINLPIPKVSDELETEIRTKGIELIEAVRVDAGNLPKISYLENKLNLLIEDAFKLTDDERKILLRSLPPRDPLVTLENFFAESKI